MFPTSLDRTDWHGFAAYQMENDSVRLVVVPETGGRIVSLFDKTAGYEWLVSPQQAHPFRVLPYGTEYNPNNTGGWDEMFPTIIAGNYPAPGRMQGTALPDHGEVWTLPWIDRGAGKGGISLAVDGRALPYRLARTISFAGPREVLFVYTLYNLGTEPLAYLWAAHPQFACEPGAEIRLPPGVTNVVNVLPLEWGAEWGPAGTRNAWPAITTAKGALLRQDLVGGPDRHGGRKFYLPPEQCIGWAGLRQPRAGCWLGMEWDPALLPYCGVWIDEGCLNQVSDVAIEPCTGYYDDLSAAWRNGRVSQVAPGGTASWQFTVRLGIER